MIFAEQEQVVPKSSRWSAVGKVCSAKPLVRSVLEKTCIGHGACTVKLSSGSWEATSLRSTLGVRGMLPLKRCVGFSRRGRDDAAK